MKGERGLIKYKINNKYHTYNGKEYKIYKKYIDGFNLPKKYAPDDDDQIKNKLIEYYKVFQEESEQIKKISYNNCIDPRKFKNEETLIRFILKLTKANITGHEQPDELEMEYIDGCNKAGIIYTDKTKEDNKAKVYYKVKAYDFSNFYLNLCGDKKAKSRKIPTKRGKAIKLKELPTPLKFGMYQVKITSDNPHIRKFFSFSPQHYYTHKDITTAYLLQRYNLINKIELIQDCEHNAYIYNDSDLIQLSDMFAFYRDKIIKMREQYPKNGILKMLSSQLYTRLMKKYPIKYILDTSDETEKYELLSYVMIDNKFYHIARKTNKPKINSVRSLPWIPSYGRNKFFSKVLKNYVNNPEEILRVYIDGAIFKSKPNFKLPNEFQPDKKYNNQTIHFKGSQVITH